MCLMHKVFQALYDLLMLDVDYSVLVVFFFQAEDGIRDLVRSRGLGDVYKRQTEYRECRSRSHRADTGPGRRRACDRAGRAHCRCPVSYTHLTLPTSDLV